MENKVRVVSKIGNKVIVNVPDIRFSRVWPAAGASVNIDREVLEELMYDTGFRNMIEMGILYIEDLEVKKELGLEPEDATEPVNIIVLSDKEKQQLLTTYSLGGFKAKVAKLSRTQCEELCNYAIDNKLIDVDKAAVLKEACGRDILRAISLNEQDKEG